MANSDAPLMGFDGAAAFLRTGVADFPAARDASAAEALSRHAGEPVHIIRRPSGRPALLPPWRELGISLSHRDDVLLCGFSPVHDTGADIERIDPDLDIRMLARDHFSDGECKALAQLSNEHARILFFRLWSAKEAILKATGRGIHDGLAHVDCCGVMEGLRMDGQPVTVAMDLAHARVATRLVAMENGRHYSTALAILA